MSTADHDLPSLGPLDCAAAFPLAISPAPPPSPADRTLRVLGVRITDVTRQRSIELLREMLPLHSRPTRCVYFVNAHTLNLAASDAAYRDVLNAGDFVFGDGTGVRWAARWQGVRLRDNLVGTDLTPQLLRAASGCGHRYFLLGGKPSVIERAAAAAAAAFPGWTQAGFQHGFFHDPQSTDEVIRRINRARANVLLVGMGNPLQEQWIHRHRQRLEVPLCLGVGGLFHYWAGDLRRAPTWLRRVGAEWLGILFQQPHKARRYLLGNPLFLWRAIRSRRTA